MMMDQYAKSLAALGHEARLSIFRLLVKAGDDGLSVGDIGEHMGIPGSTLAHHLRMLVDGDLVVQEKHGREVINRVNFKVMSNMLDFLSSECCVGVCLNRSENAA